MFCLFPSKNFFLSIALCSGLFSFAYGRPKDHDELKLKTVGNVDRMMRGSLSNNNNTEINRTEENDVPFECKPFPRSEEDPKSVHALRPGDIDFIGALGDSLTAGTGIKASLVIEVFDQHRGSVFTVGGDGNVTNNPTVANMLRVYNPNLFGFSLGIGNYKDKNAYFNVARPGQTSVDLLAQAEFLVQRMRETISEEQFKKGWKFVTILMGNNDICDSCKSENEGKFTPEKFKERLQSTLDYLHVNMPRTLVNVVNLLDVYLIQTMKKGLKCRVVAPIVCRCVAYPKDSKAVRELNDAYQAVAHNLIASGRYDNDTQFTVVVQPFLDNARMPLDPNGNEDLSYMAPDCFHLSSKGHAVAAKAFWNSLFEPVGKKRNQWEVSEPFECPNASHPYIRTAKN